MDFLLRANGNIIKVKFLYMMDSYIKLCQMPEKLFFIKSDHAYSLHEKLLAATMKQWIKNGLAFMPFRTNSFLSNC